MITFSGQPLWKIISIGTNPDRGVSAFLRHDGRAFVCRWNGCKHRIEPRDSFGCPRLVLAEEMLAHAREHGVEV